MKPSLSRACVRMCLIFSSSVAVSIAIVQFSCGQLSPTTTNAEFDNSCASEVIWLEDDRLLVIRTDGTLACHSGQEFQCQWRVRLKNVLSVMEIPATNLLVVESLGGDRNDIKNGINQIGLRIIEKDSGLVVASIFGLDFHDVLGVPLPEYYEKLFEYLKKADAISIPGNRLNELRELFINKYDNCGLRARLFRLTSDVRDLRTTRARLYWNEDSIDYCDLDDGTKNFRLEAIEIEKGIEFSNCWFDNEIGVFQIRHEHCPPSELFEIDTRTKKVRAIDFEDHDVSPDCVAVLSSARIIAAAWGTSCGLYRFDGSEIAEICVGEEDGRISCLALTYDGRSLAMAYESGIVKIVRVPRPQAYKPLSN